MSNALEVKTGELAAKRQELAGIFAQHGLDLSAELREEVKGRNDALAALGKEVEELRALASIQEKNAEGVAALNTPRHPSAFGSGAPAPAGEPERKSLGQLVCESAEFKANYGVHGGGFRPFGITLPSLDVKTVMTETGAGYAPPNYRTGIVVLSAQRRPVVADLIPQGPTNLQAVKYMEETTFTNGGAMTAEGAAFGQSALAFTERTVIVEALGAILPATEQQLMDVPQLQDLITNRLTLQLMLTEENQLLSGTGSSPQLQGFLTKTGIGTQAQGTDSIPDAILKAVTQVRYTGFAEPTGLIMHPTDWQNIRLLKTTIGSYIWGSPDGVGPERVFGLPVVVTPAITQGTALLGDFTMYSHISRNLGLRIDLGYINDDFSRFQKTIRGVERLSLEIYRAAAFSTVTGIH